MGIVLRQYQEAAIEQIRNAIRAGHRNVLLCMPTGSGKTATASWLIDACQKKLKRCNFMVDRINLVDQTSAVFDGYGIAHGIMQAGNPRWKPYERVQVCSIQTISRRGIWPEGELNIIDECHTVHKTVRDKLAKGDAVNIGLTATPFTEGLGRVYPVMVNVTTTNQLIRDGYLSRYRIFAPSEPDMTGVKVVNGEWETHESSNRALKVVGDVVEEYLKHGNGGKFICSAVDVRHAGALVEQFQAAGIYCAQYTYNVPDDVRAEMIAEFRKPDSAIRGFVTVTAASKGFDIPDLGCVIMARPLRKSLSEFIQLFGRGLRTAPGKEECIILDHSGNCKRFWDDFNVFFESGADGLDRKRIRDRKKRKKEEDSFILCPECKTLHKVMPFCPHCGHEYPKRAAVQHEAGTLEEIVSTGTNSERTQAVWPQIVSWALSRVNDPGKARRLALARYRSWFDRWPQTAFEETKPAAPLKLVINKMKQMDIAYAKARRKAGAS
ncbi:MAG: DEAD/DEAH box helicase [Oxalobacter sp.]|nr:DEAD/DEAH box helicase [Oxalobacter sp.]